MRVRLLTSRVGATGAVDNVGDIIDMPPHEAVRMIDTKQAESVEPETTALPHGMPANRRRKRRK